ncbi:MAG: threonine synthase, partial [Clostridia bacterium]
MKYYSTRDKSLNATAAKAISQGLSFDGGLFVPSELPKLTGDDFKAIRDMTYPSRAAFIIGKFLNDFTHDELLSFAENAYSGEKFEDRAVAPIKKLDDSMNILELWHGPTCAFKDMALQILPHLLTASIEKCGERKKACILVATSGDTGKAALEGFADVPGTQIAVFYPKDGVSRVQELQMTTQRGANVFVSSVVGNFDNVQSKMKEIFSDEELRTRAAKCDTFFSSANSINWGRAVPQIVYYISGYCDMLAAGTLSEGESFNVCVPTGNFGNILAAYYARE